ncbi:MAG: acyl carrier protein [Anaerolineae bacterium]|nr:acyl carrier protein [Anaerolineae bacterium]
MTDQEVFEQIKAIIVDILAIDENSITLDASFREDLGADSLDLVELIMAFEEEFHGQISDEDARSITTVQGAVTYVAERMLNGD